MKKILTVSLVLVLTFIFNSTDANAFHKVTEILPSGKLLICKDYNQIRNGSSVVTYKRRIPANKKNSQDLNNKEFITLPEIGQKINLTHKEFHQDRKVFPEYHRAEIGKAVIISANLLGEERVVATTKKNKNLKENPDFKAITLAESESILKDCLVAETEDNLKLDELASVSW